MTDSVRVVDLGNDKYEERKVRLTPVDSPWIFAAKRHLDWLAARLNR